MGDARLEGGHSDGGRSPWLEPSQATPASRSALPWIMALLAISLVAVAAFLLGRGTQPRTVPLPVRPLPMPTATERPSVRPSTPAPSPSSPAAAAPTEAPALTRAAQEGEVQPVPPVAPVGPKPEQLAAASEIAAERRRAEVRREALEREAAANRAPPPPPLPPFPRVGARGQVVQLGTYQTTAQAEAASSRFRERYRGLLATLPTSITPFRPRGGKRSFFRVQFVTPSQAYSEVVCQRLRAAGKSCIVIY